MNADTVWVLVCTALVLLMTPAVGLFYGGLVRQKNALSTLLYAFGSLSIVSIVWVLVGYSLAFGESVLGIVGGFDKVGLAGVSAELPKEGGIPELLFVAFQLTFAGITPALISGAFVERKRVAAFFLFVPLWSLLVYSPIAHWVWAEGGWLYGDGALDFAGGTVVHISSGVAALVCALMVGRRRGFGSEQISPHNATFTMLGAGLLWFGWFGFNAGSALAADAVAVNALVTTHVAAAAGGLAWSGLAWVIHGKPSALGLGIGAVAGLVGVTPAAGFVTPIAAMGIGFMTSGACYVVTELLMRGRIDDSLDVFGVHGVGGIVGAILTGVFATTQVNPGGRDGLLYGSPAQLLVQLRAVVAIGLYTAVATAAILLIVRALVGLRVSEDDEEAGLDLSQHGESAYPSLVDGTAIAS